MEKIGRLIKADRMLQGLSLRGLAEKLNGDRSLELEREVTTSWLHHLENNRAKPMAPELKRGLARALKQDESKYLSTRDGVHQEGSSFAKFFDAQLGSFQQSSTLICDFNTDFRRPEELGGLFLSLYHFLMATNGKVVVFERSNHFALPVFLTAIRAFPDVDDKNLEDVISELLTPAIADGFMDCEVPEASEEVLNWVTGKVELHQAAGDNEAAMALLATDPLSYFCVISPRPQGGMPVKKSYYHLGSKDYGPLDDSIAELAHRRFHTYREHGLFMREEYEEDFPAVYKEAARKFHIVFK